MNRYILIGLLAVAAGCDLAVEVDIPFEKKLVVNSVIHPDSVWSAQVSNNKYILDSLKHNLVNNAFVVIFENGSPADTLQSRGNGMYRSDNGKPVAGKSYELKVAAGAFDPISAKTAVPNAAPIKDFQIAESGTDAWTHKRKLSFKLLDDGSEKNFYQILLYFGYDELSDDFQPIRYYFRTEVKYDNPAEMEGSLDFDYWDGVVLNDVLFNGREKEITLQSNQTANYHMIVDVRTISEDYYNYLATKTIQTTTTDDPLAQPINAYSNIQNGFGIFAGYSSSTLGDGYHIRPKVKAASTPQATVGTKVIITVENLKIKNSERPRIILKAKNRDQKFVQAPGRVKSENTIEFEIPEGAATGKIGVSVHDVIGVSDFELEIID